MPNYSKVKITIPKKVLIALPPGLLMLIDDIAKAEFRTRSDLIREALRRYADNALKTKGVVINNATDE